MFDRYRRWLSLAVAVTDVLLINLAVVVAYWLRYNLQWFAAVDEAYLVPYRSFIPVSLALTVLATGHLQAERGLQPTQRGLLVRRSLPADDRDGDRHYPDRVLSLSSFSVPFSSPGWSFSTLVSSSPFFWASAASGGGCCDITFAKRAWASTGCSSSAPEKWGVP